MERGERLADPKTRQMPDLTLDHVIIGVADLKKRGVELLDQEPRRGLAGLICFMHPRAHAGVLVELVEAPE